jgi:hypothetical protein
MEKQRNVNLDDIYSSPVDYVYLKSLILKIEDRLERFPDKPHLFAYEADILENSVLDGAMPETGLELVKPITSTNY